MSQGDLAGGDEVIIGDVGVWVTGTVLEFDVHSPVELVEIELDGGDEAHGIVCAHAELSIDGETHLVALRYHDTYRHEDGAWRFYERDVKLLYVLPVSEFGTGLAERDRLRWPGTDRAIATLGSDVD